MHHCHPLDGYSFSFETLLDIKCTDYENFAKVWSRRCTALILRVFFYLRLLANEPLTATAGIIFICFIRHISTRIASGGHSFLSIYHSRFSVCKTPLVAATCYQNADTYHWRATPPPWALQQRKTIQQSASNCGDHRPLVATTKHFHLRGQPPVAWSVAYWSILSHQLDR